jgi:hypothetical protein
MSATIAWIWGGREAMSGTCAAPPLVAAVRGETSAAAAMSSTLTVRHAECRWIRASFR